jgi:hypothetical protein
LFTSLGIAGSNTDPVYNPPENKKNNKLALKLYEAINKQEILYPEAAFLVACDFNSASLRHVIPNFHQQVPFA